MAALSNLFPAIAESFLIILIGYGFGRFGLVGDPRESSRTITAIVGKLALPALLFRNMATLDLGHVSWRLLGSILTAKLIVFLVVVFISLLVTRQVGRSGLYGIFATQSNDFALGLPIVLALYGDDTSDDFHFSSYIYLFAPISLAIINPIGFFMLEYSKQSKSLGFTLQRVPVIVGRTLFQLILNPIVSMTLLGVLVNVIRSYALHQSLSLPSWLDHFLQVLGGAYALCALFNIGLFMVGKLRRVSGYIILVSSLLIFAKSILLPLIGYVTINLFLPDKVMNSSVEDIASFCFLYCTFPTAPTVFIYASQYAVAVPIIASAVVFGTFLSAPLMYISARMVLIRTADEDSYHHTLNAVKLNVSSISMICLVWVFSLFLLSRRYRSYLHIIIMHLMIAQFIECLGDVLLQQSGDYIYWGYLLFSIFFIGVFASRLWLVWLCIALLVTIKRGVAWSNRLWWPMLLSAWGIPMIITVTLVMATIFTSGTKGMIDSTFMFGNAQLIISASFLLFSFVIGFVSVILIVLHIMKPLSHRHDDERIRLLSNGNGHTHTQNTSSINNGSTSRESTPVYEGYTFPATTGTWDRDESGRSLTPFLVLIIFLLFSCLVGILVVLWQLVNKEITGIFIAVIVLDNATNFGQGFFVFVVFGFEKHWFWKIAYQKLRKYLFKIEIVILPDTSELSGSTIALCNQFKGQYLTQCKTDIVSDKKFYFQVYPSVFTGIDLVDWLLLQGIVTTREEAVEYGQLLMEGRVLAHSLNEHNFHDENYFYKFLI